MSHQSDSWFGGPGRYFWTSDTRLADLELGYCATKEDLARAICNMAHAGREELEIGGSAYRVHGVITTMQNKAPFPPPKTVRNTNSWRRSLKRSA